MPSRDSACPICGSKSGAEFLRRDSIPVHQNMLFDCHTAAQSIARGQLVMTHCSACDFVWNSSFDPSLLNYGDEYDNTQSYSPAFDNHMNQLVERLVKDCDVRKKSVVEVGCGKGHFLRRLVEYEGAGNRGYGFDPTYVGPDRDLDGRLRFHRSFYDEQCSNTPADIIICRHVIEHVARPLELLDSVRRALCEAPHARVFFETPCVEWILHNQVSWDFFYEHCSLFSDASLTTTFRRAGFHVNSVEHVFGGQYLWIEATIAAETSSDNRMGLGRLRELVRQFNENEQKLNRLWRQRIQSLSKKYRVALWGAGAKGVTFANLVDPRRQWIECIVDVNPNKQGKFLSGTGHPILSPGDAVKAKVSTAVVLNPNYCDEVSEITRRLGSNLSVVDLMNERANAA